MQKVLWLAPYPYSIFQNGGSSVSHPAPWVTELARELSDKVDLTIASCDRNMKQDVDLFEKDGIRFIFIRSPRFRYDLITFYSIRIKRLYDCLKQIDSDYDVIHVHGTEHQYEYIGEKLGIPYIISIQGIIGKCIPLYPHKCSATYYAQLVTYFYERLGIKRGSNFFCRTGWDSEYVRCLNPRARVFLSWELIRDDFLEDLYDKDSKNILFLGGTKTFKGIRETVLCLNILKRQNRNFKLQICGKGSWDKIDKFVRDNDLIVGQEDIEFLGYQSGRQLANVFSKAFCLIHPSYMDNSPNSICEAQVAGLPVVATDVGGVRSLIEHGKTGLLVDRYDYTALARQVLRLLNEKDIYRNISINSRSVSRNRHDRQTIISNTVSAYTKLISTP